MLISKKLLTNNLTAWDSAFLTANSNRKKRLIIFDSKREKDLFLQDNSSRKIAFINANPGFLYYAVKQDLFREYKKRYPNNKIKFKSYKTGNELYLEFAFIKSVVRNLEMLIFSDYDNSNSTPQKDTEPLVFIDPKDNDSKYNSKVSDSLHLDKMISYRFDELLTSNLIYKV